jgi:hypothetical protein
MFEIDSFYLIVLSVAIFILIVALGFVGWMLSRQNDQVKFPSITTTCPDFWKIDDKGNCVRPSEGNFNRGTTLTKEVPGHNIDLLSFNPGSAWGSGDAAICKKKKWADNSGVKWDTVTNVNFC